VSPAGSSALNAAGRNATITSLMVCCGFIVCWTPNQVIFFLNSVGYPVDFGGWFYHFTSPATTLLQGCQSSKVRFLYLDLFSSIICLTRNKLSTIQFLPNGFIVVPSRYRFHQLVLPLHRGTGGRQQLHQPFHLRRQISRVQGRR